MNGGNREKESDKGKMNTCSDNDGEIQYFHPSIYKSMNPFKHPCLPASGRLRHMVHKNALLKGIGAIDDPSPHHVNRNDDEPVVCVCVFVRLVVGGG